MRVNDGLTDELALHGKKTGLALAAFAVIQALFGFAINNSKLSGLYSSDQLFQSSALVFLSFLAIFVPFRLVLRSDRRTAEFDYADCLSAPPNLLKAAAAVPVGLMLCFSSILATQLVTHILESLGFSYSAPELVSPVSSSGSVLFLLSNALMPALTEEFAIRCVVLQPLRKYGTGFACFASALIFSIMHGNLPQAVFTFPSGLVLAYAVIKTESLWTGILIHFFNNALSVVTVLISINCSPEASTVFYQLYMIVTFVLAAIGAFYLVSSGITKRERSLIPNLKPLRKLYIYFFNAYMLFFVLVFIVLLA